MEALAVIGLACNILQLVEYGDKAIRIAKELHDPGQATTQSNTEATFVAQKMRELSNRLIKDIPTSNLTEDEQALCQLAQKCSAHSNGLLSLLESLKLNKPAKKINVMKTVWKNIKRRNELSQLKLFLDDSRKQLNIQIVHMSRSDIAQKLELILNNSSISKRDLIGLKDSVQKLQEKSAMDLDSTKGLFRDIQGTLDARLRQNAILQSIRDPQMHKRFDDVADAHEKTFEWLLHGPEGYQGGEQQDNIGTAENDESILSGPSRAQAKFHKHREFVTWLQGANNSSSSRQGNVFHILGKPGAGKSTLMKFLCQNQATREHLKTWSGEKRIICARAFFWRLGDDEQKSLAGLKNCLLHQILTVAPELIPTALPSAWESNYGELASLVPSSTTLDTLLKGSRAFEKHKMILFIDGLDEFKGRPTDLINDILGWADSNPAGLKICVASREWPEFLIRFEKYPKLRIQECTLEDIEIFVRGRLGEHYVPVDQQQLDSLAGVIVGKAEGVFIWVRVVLAAIEQGVYNGDDFQDLQKKVDAFPAELNDLYQHLLDSIPDPDRQAAFTALTISTMCTRGYPALLQYKFLNDLSKDPDFAIKLSMQPLSEQELDTASERASRLINGRCKGFLEIRPMYQKRYRGEKGVQFMHSTAEEFLSQERIVETMRPCLNGIDILDQWCQSFLAFMKSIDSDEFYNADMEIARCRAYENTINEHLESLFIIFSDHSRRAPKKSVLYSKRRLSRLLDNVQQVVTTRLEKRLESDQTIIMPVEVRYSPVDEDFYVLEVPPSQILSVLAANHYIFEYFDNDRLGDLRTLPADSMHTKQILDAFFCCHTRHFNPSISFKMFELFFEAGMSPRIDVELLVEWAPEKTYHRFNLWGFTFLRLLFNGPCEYPLRYEPWNPGSAYRLIELFLRYGVTEELYIKFGPCYEEICSDRLIVQVQFMGSKHMPVYDSGRILCVDYQLDIIRYARQREGLLTLRDLLAHCFPYDFHHLYAILDRKSSTSPASNAIVDSYNTHSIEMLHIFPNENQYTFSESSAMAGWKQCLSHSEDCFRNFEARLGHSHE
ncbi:hypothetical protein F5B20DRAFT_345999 [Whalleya microplaca]|nr:hypothetical protein F5B20DRAFT_345999 [Whalleya microplaca]